MPLGIGIAGGRDHLFVEEPFLETENLGALPSVQLFVAEKSLDGLVGEMGAVVVKGRRTQ